MFAGDPKHLLAGWQSRLWAVRRFMRWRRSPAAWQPTAPSCLWRAPHLREGCVPAAGSPGRLLAFKVDTLFPRSRTAAVSPA